MRITFDSVHEQRVYNAFTEVRDEYKSASGRFPDFNSSHEGWAILREEVDELWDEVKRNADPARLRAEAKQVAAMAIRFMIDCT